MDYIELPDLRQRLKPFNGKQDSHALTFVVLNASEMVIKVHRSRGKLNILYMGLASIQDSLHVSGEIPTVSAEHGVALI